jgi:hypothetical protein
MGVKGNADNAPYFLIQGPVLKYGELFMFGWIPARSPPE